jgi:hypothetical protein
MGNDEAATVEHIVRDQRVHEFLDLDPEFGRFTGKLRQRLGEAVGVWTLRPRMARSNLFS